MKTETKQHIFSYFETVISPVAVCNRDGKIIFKNALARKHLEYPRTGLSIEAGMQKPKPDGRDISPTVIPGVKRPVFRDSKDIASYFPTAVVLPTEVYCDGEYDAWIFDALLAGLDRSERESLAEKLIHHKITAKRDTKFAASKDAMIYTRLALALYDGIFFTRSQSRFCDAFYTLHRTSNMLSDVLSSFGCRVSTYLPRHAPGGILFDGQEFSVSLIQCILYMFALYQPHSVSLEFYISNREASARLTAEVRDFYPGQPSGGFDELFAVYPQIAPIATITRGIFDIRKRVFSFAVDNRKICFLLKEHFPVSAVPII